jgi:uncharacterized RDD family membrane protein YckC
MKHSLRRGFLLSLALASLCVFAGTAWAQDTEPTPPAAAEAPPPVEVEAPDTPAAAETPNVEATDDDTQRAPWDREEWRHRRGNDRVAVGSNASLGKDQRADSVISVLGSSTSEGYVSDAVVSVLGDTRVTGSTQDAIAVLGSVYLNGEARGNVVAVLGNVELGPQAKVNGDLVVVGGTLTRDPASEVRGQISNVLAMGLGSAEWIRPWARHCLIYFRPLAIAPGLGWAWGLAFGFLALYVLIAIMFRDAVDRCVTTFETQPGKSILAAILTTLLTPVVFMLLVITVIGIAFVPLAGLGLFLMSLFGKAVMLAWIGRACLRLSSRGAELHTAVAVVLGGVIVTLLYLVPFLGFVVYKTLGILGLGVAAYALLLSIRQKRGESGPGPELAAAGAGAGGGGAMFSESTNDYSTSMYARDYTAPSSGTTFGFDERRSGEPGTAGTSDGQPSWSEPFGEAGTASASGMMGPRDQADNAGAASSAGAYGTASQAGTAGASSTAGTSGPSGASGSQFTPGAGGPPPSGPPPGSPPPYSPSGSTSIASAAHTYPRAGFMVRMGALLIDIILIAVLLGIVDSTRKAELIALATYGAVMWKLKGTTIGGIVFGLQVVRVDGRPIDWATATVRALSCFLSLAIAGLGFIWIAFDEGRQAWHDKIAGTAVVRVPKGVSLL